MSKDPIIRYIGKAGYMARAVIYLVIGVLSILSISSLTEYAGQKTDSKGAINFLTHLPFSTTLLTLLTIGFLCYSSWRFLQAILDADDHGKSLKGIIIRLGLSISCLTHLSLSFYTFTIITGNQDSSSKSKSDYASQILSYEFGQIVLFLIGVIVFIFGLSQIYKGINEKYKKYMNLKSYKKLVNIICKTGLCARGLVFCIIGTLTAYSAYLSYGEKTGGLNKIWEFLGSLPMGEYYILMIGGGLILFGLYSVSEAVYREVST